MVALMYNEIHFKELPSTNDYAKEHIKEFDREAITLITAEGQTKGHGQHGRAWHSPAKKNLYASFVFFLPRTQKDLSHLAQLLSFSCAIVVKSLGLTPKLKHPNDLLVDGKKLAGALVEMITTSDSISVIAGIGLNVNMEQTACDLIDQPATSLLLLTNKLTPLEEIKTLLKGEFAQNLERFKEEGFAPFRSAYQEMV